MLSVVFLLALLTLTPLMGQCSHSGNVTTTASIVDNFVDHLLLESQFSLNGSVKVCDMNTSLLLGAGTLALSNGVLYGLTNATRVPFSSVIVRRDADHTWATADIRFNSVRVSYQNYSLSTLLFTVNQGNVLISSNASAKLHFIFSGEFQCNVSLHKVEVFQFNNFHVIFNSTSQWWKTISEFILDKVFYVFNTWVKTEVEDKIINHLGEATNITRPFYVWECTARHHKHL